MSHSLHRRWQAWQQSLLSHRYLHPRAAKRYSLLPVPPGSREGFFAVVELFLARRRLEAALPTHQAAPEAKPDLEPLAKAWHDWVTVTHRLAAYTLRLAEGKEGTVPAMPEALLALLALEKDEKS